jgi:hypothetical protein
MLVINMIDYSMNMNVARSISLDKLTVLLLLLRWRWRCGSSGREQASRRVDQRALLLLLLLN